MAQNPNFDKNKKVTKKVWYVLSRQILVSDNSAADWARELFKHCEDSESLV